MLPEIATNSTTTFLKLFGLKNLCFIKYVQLLFLVGINLNFFTWERFSENRWAGNFSCFSNCNIKFPALASKFTDNLCIIILLAKLFRIFKTIFVRTFISIVSKLHTITIKQTISSEFKFLTPHDRFLSAKKLYANNLHVAI